MSCSVYTAARAASPAHHQTPLFITPNTNLAVYLIITGKLPYRGARLATTHDGVEFLFDDPNDTGTKMMRAFKSRSAEPVDPNALFEAQGFLKSEVKRIRVGVANVQSATL
jgi:hypothetical protein